jgi:hypothetical protein
MRLTNLLRAGVAALALVGAAGVGSVALAQSGEAAGDATGIARAINVGTMNSLFPQTVVPMPMPQSGGGLGGFADRVKQRESNFPDRSNKVLINAGTPYVYGIFGGIVEGAGLTGGVEFTTADLLGEQVELYGDALVSTRLYRRFEGGAIIGKERDRAEVRYVYTRRTRDNFFGLGPFSDDESVESPTAAFELLGGETNYDREIRQFQAGYAHYFVENKFSVGVYVDYASTSIYEGADEGEPSIFSLYLPYLAYETVFPASPEVFVAQVPGLSGSKIATYGVYTEADYRNTDRGLTQGFYGYLRFAGHDGIDDDFNTLAGPTAFGWNQFTADLRGYIPVFSDKNSIALRFFTDLNDRRGADVIPFYNLAKLGGTSTLRGFETYRFYGEKALLFQGEYRREIAEFGEDRAIDLNLFGDAGQVWGLGFEPRAPVLFDFDRFDSYDTDNYEADLGVGVTGRFGTKFAIRIDYAHSNEKDRFKFTFTRGF